VSRIGIAESDDSILRCFPVMRQLRTHVEESDFVQRVRLQQDCGYELADLEDGGQVRSVAGFRLLENLAAGRILYVDDLVTDSMCRSQGFGKTLFAWLVQRARDERCRYLELDSGVQRFDAHRFYLTSRMIISSHHFALKL
jgi:GNAT superfamily N-acetyltransferase